MNENLYKVLELLYQNKDGRCSGEDIGQRLGMSRAGVGKHINTLKKFGFNIISGTKTGHMLKDDRDVLNEYYIRLKLCEKNICIPVIFKQKTSSTNIDGKESAAKFKNAVIVAQTQTGGRGRKERAFLSDFGGLYFSYIISPQNLKPYDALKTVLLCGIAVCRVCKKSGIDAKLKWPNDVMAGDKKLCGILAEMVSSSDILQHLILGIGINVNNEIHKNISTAISYKELKNKEYKRAEILADCIFELNNIFSEFCNSGFEQFTNEYKNLSNTLGKEVKIVENEKSFTAIAQDLDRDGFLIVKTKDGEMRLVTADVSIR